ncbi:MAG: hypothetical protein ACRDIB_14965, partial [Ardenticatenaceae bacterium]
LYVAPATLGYAFSHPRFNIYKGRMGAWKFLGFGLDAIPHGVTAYAITLLIHDGLEALGGAIPLEAAGAPGVPLLFAQRGVWAMRMLAKYPALWSGLGLALLSAIWEGGEFLMQRDELRRAAGDTSEINMEWGLKDSIYDLFANVIGWGAASWQRARQRTRCGK